MDDFADLTPEQRQEIEQLLQQQQQQFEDAKRRLQQNPNDLDALLQRAGGYLHHQEFDAAWDDVQQVLKQNPNHSQALSLAGILTMHRGGSSNEGFELMMRAMEADPDQARQGILKRLNFNQEFAPDDFDESDDPKMARWERIMGMSTEQFKQLSSDQALAQSTEILLQDPANVDALFQRASGYVMTDQFELALQDYDLALASNPDADQIISAYARRAHCFQQLNQLDQARACYDVMIEKDPNHHVAYAIRGEILIDQHQYEKALPDLQKALQLWPKDSKSYLLLGNAFRKLGRPQDALDAVNHALEIDQQEKSPFESDVMTPWIHHERGHVYRTLDQLDLALKDYNQALEITPDWDNVVFDRAFVLQQLHRFDEAVEGYEKLLQKYPDDDLTKNNLAFIYSGCADAGVRDGNKAVQLALAACENSEWNNWMFLDTLAASYAEAGAFEKAISTQQKTLELAPPDEQAACQERLALYQAHQPFRWT